MSDESVRALAKRFFDCLEQGDMDGLAACCAPDAEIWRNTDEAVESLDAHREAIAGTYTRILGRVFDNRRVEVFPGGFVQQHVLRATRANDGAQLTMPTCVFCTVKDGEITRLDEYFDSVRVAEFRKATT